MPNQSYYKSWIRGLKRQRAKARNEFHHLDQSPNIVKNIINIKNSLMNNMIQIIDNLYTIFSLKQHKIQKLNSKKKDNKQLNNRTIKNEIYG